MYQKPARHSREARLWRTWARTFLASRWMNWIWRQSSVSDAIVARIDFLFCIGAEITGRASKPRRVESIFLSFFFEILFSLDSNSLSLSLSLLVHLTFFRLDAWVIVKDQKTSDIERLTRQKLEEKERERERERILYIINAQNLYIASWLYTFAVFVGSTTMLFH